MLDECVVVFSALIQANWDSLQQLLMVMDKQLKANSSNATKYCMNEHLMNETYEFMNILIMKYLTCMSMHKAIQQLYPKLSSVNQGKRPSMMLTNLIAQVEDLRDLVCVY